MESRVYIISTVNKGEASLEQDLAVYGGGALVDVRVAYGDPVCTHSLMIDIPDPPPSQRAAIMDLNLSVAEVGAIPKGAPLGRWREVVFAVALLISTIANVDVNDSLCAIYLVLKHRV